MGSHAAVEEQLKRPVVTKTADYDVKASDHGATFVAGAADLVFTLPPANRRTAGMEVTVITGVASSGTGTSLSPASTDKIQGKGLTAADDKDLINSGASDAVGDKVTLVCDGEDGWWVKGMLGTWARES